MSTITEYIETNMASFEERPFNAVDSLVLSQFCGMRLEAIEVRDEPSSRPGRIRQMIADRIDPKGRKRESLAFGKLLRAEHFSEMFKGYVTAKSEDLRRLLCALAASPRFRNMKITRYSTLLDEEDATQFAAISFVYKELFAYIGFRGTDATVTGWREDFDMGYKYPVPSQVLALDYVNSVAKELPSKLILGGHSKGGNLAVFAAVKSDASIRNRIEQVYDHDGPGFKPSALSDYDVVKMGILVDKTVPKGSLVGMLLEDPSRIRVVRSRAKGIDQHSAFTWEVNDAGTDFELEEGIAPSSIAFKDTFDDWMGSYDEEGLEAFVDSLFQAIDAKGIKDVRDLLDGSVNPILKILGVALSASTTSKNVLLDAASRYARLLTKRLVTPTTVEGNQDGQGY